MRRWCLTVLAGLLATAAPVRAQGPLTVLQALIGQIGVAKVSETDVRATVTGQLTISFHGEQSAGCATYGVCGYSGTVGVRPGGALLEIDLLRSHGRLTHSVELFLQAGPSEPITTAEVQRSLAGEPEGVCADASSALFDVVSGDVHGGSVTLSLLQPGGTLIETRCAGPLDGDLAGLGPRVTLPLGFVARGDTAMDLSASGSFASHGFAGTVSSSIVLHFGAPERLPQTGLPPSLGVSTSNETRTVTDALSVVRVRGSMTAHVIGASDPQACSLLDSCGIDGTLRFTPTPREASSELVASGPASRPSRDFLTALGLSTRGRASGISVLGLAGWQDVGVLRSELTQGGQCTDAAPLGAGDVLLAANGKLVVAVYYPSSLRTRCPGPFPSSENGVAFGTAPLRSLGRRTFTIVLRPSPPFDDDGYSVRPSGTLMLTLRHGPITQQITT